MRSFLALALLLIPSFVFADAPRVSPSKATTAPGKWFRFKVEADPKKTLVMSELPFNDFDVREDTKRPGVYRVDVADGVKQGTYRVELWHAGDTLTLPKSGPLPALPIATLTIQVGEPKPPAPNPDDPKPKPKPPDPAPDNVIPTTATRMLIVEEEKDRTRIPANIQLSMFAAVVWDAVGQERVRIIDKDDDVRRLDPWYQKAFELAKGKPLPYVVVGNGQKQFDGPVANTYQEMLAIIRKLGE